MTFWFDIFKDQAKVFHFQIVLLWTQWRREKTSREWWRASTSSSNSCCPLWRMARWMTSILLRLRRRWRGTSPGASKPWQPERKDSWESLHRSWLIKVCPPPYLSPPPPLLCLPSTQKGKAVMDAQEEVNKAIKARKKMLKAGSYVYEIDIKSAEHTWKVWSSSLLSHIALSLLLLHDFFLSLSFPQPPSHSSYSKLIFWMQGATNLPWPQASVGKMKLDLSSSFFDLIQALGKGISPQFTSSKMVTND